MVPGERESRGWGPCPVGWEGIGQGGGPCSGQRGNGLTLCLGWGTLPHGNGEEAGVCSWRASWQVGPHGCGDGAVVGCQGLGIRGVSAPVQCPIFFCLGHLLAWGLPCQGDSEWGTAAVGLAVGCTHMAYLLFSPQMAQRLVLRRLLSLTIRTLPLQGQRMLSGPLAPRAPLVPHGKAFGTSASCRSTFNVQDGSDFQDRVVNNPKPVVVDFHAQ